MLTVDRPADADPGTAWLTDEQLHALVPVMPI
jgi:hypothetical protein